jgi:hypothetical protein
LRFRNISVVLVKFTLERIVELLIII